MSDGADTSDLHAAARTLPGIGPVTQRWLEASGIRSVHDLRVLGAVEAYRRVKFMRPREANLNALYALEAALRGCHWLHLPPDVKSTLEHEAKAIETAHRKAFTFRSAPDDDGRAESGLPSTGQ